jgi:hypothetical protein
MITLTLPHDRVRGCHAGTAASITNLRSGACVHAVVGDCGGTPPEGGCKVHGYGEISYAAAKAIGVYVRPEEASSDPIQIHIGAAVCSTHGH